MNKKILSLYAKGMTTREIVSTFKEMYGADVSATLISNVTNAVIDRVTEWQSSPLDAIYPIVYLDCIVLKIRQDKQVINKVIWHWVSIWMATKNCWVYGCHKMKVANFGLMYSRNFKTVA